MVNSKDVDRIDNWVQEAFADGAKILLYYPTILTDVAAEMKVIKEEAFGPIASVDCCEDFEQALQQAGESLFTLQEIVFTKNIYISLLVCRMVVGTKKSVYTIVEV